MNRDKFMQMAIDLAASNLLTGKGGPFGAVIVKNGEVVGKGSNEVTSTNDPTAHAEVVAIRDACKNLNSYQLEDCEVYASCEPCPMCLGAIYWSRVKKLYFAATREDAANAGFDDSYIYNQVPLKPEKRDIGSVQLMRPQAVKVFEKWIESEQKIPY
ncbi:MAG: nucleoside deaminase [Bacteroidales bacterium]|nr:nucleoside deaminase [Bacteroidales bacterium]